MQLEIEKVSKSFGRKKVLENVSFQAESGKSLVWLEKMAQESPLCSVF